mgnify:CR=1 FL=1
MKRLLQFFGLGLALIMASTGAQATIINFGVDIRPGENYAQVGFYDGQPSKGGNDGVTLSYSNQSLSFTILTPGLAGSTINGFELFVDAAYVDREDNFDVKLLNTGSGFVIVIDDFPSNGGYREPATYVPVEAGPLGNHRLSPYEGDVDNSFFLSIPAGLFADEILAGALNVKIVRNTDGGEARFDGVNLQIDYTRAPVPEPVTMLLLASGLMGLWGMRRRIKK